MPDAYMPDPNYPPSNASDGYTGGYSGGYSGPAQPNTSPDSYYGTYGSQQLAQPTVPATPPPAYPPLAPIPAPSSVPMIAPHMQQMGVYPATVPTHDKGGTLAMASLVLGIFGVAVGWLPLCGIVAVAPAIIAVVLGGVGLQSHNRRGLAVAGIVLGLAGLALAFTLAI